MLAKSSSPKVGVSECHVTPAYPTLPPPFDVQEEYYQTHQVFLTIRALYLLVWNVTDGPRGIVDGMGVWLRTLQVRITMEYV